MNPASYNSFKLIEYIKIGIQSAGHSDLYATGFCNALILIKSVIENEEPHYVDEDDGWSVKMKDGSIGCHCEHSILVLPDGYEVLTLAE